MSRFTFATLHSYKCGRKSAGNRRQLYSLYDAPSGVTRMLPSTNEEKTGVAEYFLSQSGPKARVKFLQKVYAETIMGHRHDVWDLHAKDGRWWIITNPTNLYSQKQFPNMDLAITFHMGLCLRIPRADKGKIPPRAMCAFGEAFTKLRELEESLSRAQNLGDYQAVGMRARETLLAFVAGAQDAAKWTEDAPPQRANFRAWTDIICNAALPGERQKERRHLLKTMLAEAWTFTNWLTHAQSATWHDAEAAYEIAEHSIGSAASLVIRHVQSVPEECPKCGSPNLLPQEGFNEAASEIVWERPVCDDCGWSGTPFPVEIDQDYAIIEREGGGANDKCAIMTTPLMKLDRPEDAEN